MLLRIVLDPSGFRSQCLTPGVVVPMEPTVYVACSRWPFTLGQFSAITSSSRT